MGIEREFPGAARVERMVRPGPVLRTLLRTPRILYRWHLGRLLGHRFLLLVHRGRRTGRTYRTVIEVLQFNRAESEAVVMSGFGPRSDWFRNVDAGGARWVEVGSEGFLPAWRALGVDEATDVLGAYEHRNRLVRPILRVVLSRLVGWRYDGSEEARRKLVAELPLLAFRPAPSSEQVIGVERMTARRDR